MLTHNDTFIHGFIVDGKTFREFVLEEEVMRHTFQVSNDFTLDHERLAGDEKKKIGPDLGYYSACIMAARIKVAGIKVTAEMVEELPKADCQLLLVLSAQLEQRRELFRTKTEAAQKRSADAPETGLPGGGSAAKE